MKVQVRLALLLLSCWWVLGSPVQPAMAADERELTHLPTQATVPVEPVDTVILGGNDMGLQAHIDLVGRSAVAAPPHKPTPAPTPAPVEPTPVPPTPIPPTPIPPTPEPTETPVPLPPTATPVPPTPVPPMPEPPTSTPQPREVQPPPPRIVATHGPSPTPTPAVTPTAVLTAAATATAEAAGTTNRRADWMILFKSLVLPEWPTWVWAVLGGTGVLISLFVIWIILRFVHYTGTDLKMKQRMIGESAATRLEERRREVEAQLEAGNWVQIIARVLADALGHPIQLNTMVSKAGVNPAPYFTITSGTVEYVLTTDTNALRNARVLHDGKKGGGRKNQFSVSGIECGLVWEFLINRHDSSLAVPSVPQDAEWFLVVQERKARQVLPGLVS